LFCLFFFSLHLHCEICSPFHFLMAASHIWVSPLRPHSNVGVSDLGLRRCVDMRCNWDLERLPRWECCCLSVLAQRAITPVEDEKPLIPQVETSEAIDQVQNTQSRGFHKDLNLLPSELLHIQLLFFFVVKPYLFLLDCYIVN